MINIEEILVFSIVALAFLIAGRKLYMTLKGKKSGCEGCASDCSGCSLVDLKKNIEEAKSRKKINEDIIDKNFD